MAKEKYEPPKIEILNKKDEPVDITPSHGNTRLPFGLCMRYGIAIGKDWTPRDAWDALAGKGITPDEVYSDVKKDGKVNEVKAESKTEQKEETDTTDRDYENSISLKIHNESEENKRIILEQASLIPKEYRETVSSAIDGLTIQVGSGEFSPSENTLRIPTNDFQTGKIDTSFHAKGEVFAHETGHAIDCRLSEPFDRAKAIERIEKEHPRMGMVNKFRLLSEMENNHAASNWMILSNGKTLNDTIVEERRSVDWKQIQRDCGEEVKRYWKEQGIDYDAAIQKYTDEKNKLDARLKEEYAKIEQKTRNVVERVNQRSAVREKLEKETESYQEAEKVFDLVRDTNSNGVSKYWSSVADIYDAYAGGFYFKTLDTFLPSVGHDMIPGYWKEYGTSGMEFFAEAHAAMTAVPRTKEIMKKYFPKSWSAFEELYGKLRK